MIDRKPGSPGRVMITPESSGTSYYATMAMADNPEAEGTPLNKANLLSDDTVSKLEMPTTPEPTPDLAIQRMLQIIKTEASKKIGVVYGSWRGSGGSRTIFIHKGLHGIIVNGNSYAGEDFGTAVSARGVSSSLGISISGTNSVHISGRFNESDGRFEYIAFVDEGV